MIDLIRRAVQGNEQAFRFFTSLYNVLQVWDDLIDKDKPVGPEAVNMMMWTALIDIPRNPFYQANFNDLNPILMSSIVNWHGANTMEATDSEADKEIAFITRSAYVDLLIQSALIIGGVQWAIQMTPEIRRLWHDEGLAGYKAALAEQFERAQ